MANATWRDNLYNNGLGSFRGKKFYVPSVTSDVGRRTVIHEFPGKDIPTVEDLGRKSRRYRLEAFVLGNNYMAERDKLRKEFEKPGTGELIHPYWGKMTVTVAGIVSITESTESGGMARFTLDVIESGKAAPLATPDTIAEVQRVSATAFSACMDELDGVWAVVGYISAVADAATAMVNEATSVIAKVNGKINAVMNKIDAISDAITAISDSVSALILLPGQLANSINAVMANVLASANQIGSAWDSYFEDNEDPGNAAGAPAKAPSGGAPTSGDVRATLIGGVLDSVLKYGDDFATVVTTTPTRLQMAANQLAFIRFVKTSAVIATCQVVAEVPFASYNKATEMRDRLVSELDTLCEGTEDDAMYSALVDLRAAISAHLAQVSSTLPMVQTYTIDRRLPALVVSQNLYGTPTREVDIIDRNDIKNPCLVPSGTPLEVLGA